jgi:hypothetical protein
MAITLHPDGGFILTKLVAGGQLETRLKWRQHVDGMAVEIIGGGNGTSLVAMLVDLLGGGLQVEFDQSLLGAGQDCGQPTSQREETLRKRVRDLSGDILSIAGKLDIEVPELLNPGDPDAFSIVQNVLLQIGEQVTGAQVAELLPLDEKGPTSPFDKEPQPTSSDPLLSETKPATIAGVPVAEAQPEQPKRKRRTREQIAADEAAAAAAKQVAQQLSPEEAYVKAVGQAALAKAGMLPAQPTTPDPVATAAFQADMAVLSGKIDELPKVSLVEVKPPAAAAQQPEQRVEPAGDALDEMVDLLSNPPMPVDIHPLDSKRSASDTQFLDSAHIRLYYGYPLVEEYAKDPKFKPGNPPAPGVNLRTDEGVVAAVQWLAKIHERAGLRGVAIPQLDLFFGLGELPEVIEASVVKVRARREAQAAALQGRR